MAGHKIVSPKLYLINISVLGVLMTLTIMFGKMETLNFSSNPNGINLAIAVGIAIAKAFCIVSIFMGVAFASNLVRIVAISGFAWLIILFSFILTDYVNPSAEWGTPYHDSASPGTSPLPGGQDFLVHGSERLLVKSGVEYVAPHGGGHEEDDDAAEGDEYDADDDAGH